MTLPHPRSDRFTLARFVEAQEPVYESVRKELHQGKKTSHWMWFIFPQITGLGSSSTAKFFAIENLDEALAYINHPILGTRLVECCDLVLDIPGRSASEIFGYPDDLKLRSSMTLFYSANPNLSVFRNIIDLYYLGQLDAATLRLIHEKGSPSSS